MQREGNYAKQLLAAQRQFRTLAYREIAERFSLPMCGNDLMIVFLGESYRISAETGELLCCSDGREADFNTGMTIFDMLANPNGRPVLSGRWCDHSNFNAVRGGTLTGELKLSDKTAQCFAGKTQALRRACAAIGARETAGGDYSCMLPLFPFFPLRLRFYDADEEFPAKLQLLWDENTPRCLHYETTFYAAGAVFARLAGIAGVSAQSADRSL